MIDLPSLPSDPIPVTPLVVPTLNGVAAWYFPAVAISALAISLYAAAWALVPKGPRSRARGVVTAVLLVVCAARIELGAAYPTAAFYAVALAATVAFVVYEWLTPDESFPVSYARGGNAAHLELAGARSDAVKVAMRDQLGLEVTDLKAFGDEGSGGSTPLLMTLADGPQLFGKILATSHARADRWYRIGRTILYGQLEDETPFGVGAAPDRLRGLRAAAPRRRGLPGREDLRGRRADPEPRVPAAHGVLRGLDDARPRRRHAPRWSTRGSR